MSAVKVRVDNFAYVEQLFDYSRDEDDLYDQYDRGVQFGTAQGDKPQGGVPRISRSSRSLSDSGHHVQMETADCQLGRYQRQARFALPRLGKQL